MAVQKACLATDYEAGSLQHVDELLGFNRVDGRIYQHREIGEGFGAAGVGIAIARGWSFVRSKHDQRGQGLGERPLNDQPAKGVAHENELAFRSLLPEVSLSGISNSEKHFCGRDRCDPRPPTHGLKTEGKYS